MQRRKIMQLNTFKPTLENAKQLDQEDSLSSFRNEFYLKPDSIYMDGNSLGLLSKRAERRLIEVLNDWKEQGIDGWTQGKHPWFSLSEKLGEMSAPLVGASSEEVIVTGSTTVNLHQLVATFYNPKGTRTKILADELTFPSDIYALQSQLRTHGYSPDTHLIRVKSRDGRFLEEDDIIEAMTNEIALIILPTVLYRSGQILDMERLTAEAHNRGILIGFDGCHSIGAIPHSFSKWDVDFAYWCNYKHLNGGPGCVGGLYVNKKRGGHVSLEHKEAARICKALKENGIIPDFRAPNIIRLAPVALYTSYTEVWEVVQTLKKIMNDKEYEKFKNE